MTGIASLKFLNNQDVDRIGQTLKKHIRPEYANKAQDFIPLLALKIDQKCAEIFEEIQEEAKKGYLSKSYLLAIDNDNAMLISECLMRITPVSVKGAGYKGYKGIKNCLISDIFQDKTYMVNLNIGWTPNHPSYQYKGRIRRYQFDPAAHNKMLYTFAKNATKTDIIFKSSDHKEIPAHKLILCLNSPYFDGMFKRSSKDADQNNIPFSCHSNTINSLIQFIYEGRLDKDLLSPEMLVELLPMAARIENKELLDHCIDLLNDYLLDSKVSEEVIIEALNFAYTYDIQDFIVPCLKQAEDLEVSAAESQELATVDWSKIKKQNYANLLTFAVKNSFENVVKKLSVAINQTMKT